MTLFEAMYRRNLSFVWRLLQRLGVAERDLEDTAHEVFLVTFRRFGVYDPTRSESAWLAGISTRVAADYRRRQRRHPEEPTCPEAMERAGAAGPAEEQELADLCRVALAQLDFDHRSAVVLSDIYGFTAVEIAEALDAPVNTIYARIRRARARLGKLVEAGSRLPTTGVLPEGERSEVR